MIISKDNNNNWTPVATGNGTFVGTENSFNEVKDTLPNNTVAYITDDGNSDLQPVDAVTNGDMHPVTSNAVYDKLNGFVKTFTFTDFQYTIPHAGGYLPWHVLMSMSSDVPKLAIIKLTKVYRNGVDSDAWAEIKSSKYGLHIVFTDTSTGLPLEEGTVITISGVVNYVE